MTTYEYDTPALLVMVASADKSWRASCTDRLITSGCDVHTASNGQRAIDELRKHRFDLIVIEDSMPDLSAFELHLNVQDIVRETPPELIATKHMNENARKRLTNGSDIRIGTPQEVLDQLVPTLERVQRT